MGARFVGPVCVHGSLFVAGDAWTHGAFSGEVIMQLYSVAVFGAQYRLGMFGFLALQELIEEVLSVLLFCILELYKGEPSDFMNMLLPCRREHGFSGFRDTNMIL